MPDNIRRFDELIRGVHRITAYDLCSILSIGKVSVMAIFQSLAIPRSFLVWGCECWQMHTKRPEKQSPLTFTPKQPGNWGIPIADCHEGWKEPTILNQNSSGSRRNGVIRYLQGRRNSRVLCQMEVRGYSLLGWEGSYYCELRPLYWKTKKSGCSLSSISSHENNVARPYTNVLTTETDQF